MGLDISTRGHSFRAGSYSGFDSFRNWLAQKVGYESYPHLLDKTSEKAGEWISARQQSKKASTAVKAGALFHHSDCEGFISSIDARKLYKDLVEIKANLPPVDNPPDDEAYYRAKLDDWILAAKCSKDTGATIDFF